VFNPTLRSKTVATGALVALGISVLASASTFFLARAYMVDQRVDTARAQVLSAARLLTKNLSSSSSSLDSLLDASRVLPGSLALLRQGDDWVASGVGVSEANLPRSLVSALNDDRGASQLTSLTGKPAVVIGLPVAASVTTWFVAFLPLTELDRTLGILRIALTMGTLLATIGGAVIGAWLSRRVMEPLQDVSNTALVISGGDLNVRARTPSEPDLAQIARSFNMMAQSLQDRIKREAQFGAMVSHELRSPLTVIKGATEIIESRRAELPERAQMGLDLLKERVGAFERILNDLIEISRYEVGSVEPSLESRNLALLLETLLGKFGLDVRILAVDDVEVSVDVKRFQQLFENIVRNAELYANGLVSISSEVNDRRVLVHFDDSGIGIPEVERERVFEPFVRGLQHSAVKGSGLGLAISLEHAKIMNGQLLVASSPEGGARFTLILRIDEPEQT
jgi:signal transduction histidine kinase